MNTATPLCTPEKISVSYLLASQHLSLLPDSSLTSTLGNIVVIEPRCIRSLLASVSVYLHNSNTKWVVLTSITSLKNALAKLQRPMLLLGEATIAHIPPSERAAWGAIISSGRK